MKEQETHFCGDPSECHYDEGYEKALKECKKMFDDYNKKLKDEVWDLKGQWCKRRVMELIDKLSKEVLGE